MAFLISRRDAEAQRGRRNLLIYRRLINKFLRPLCASASLREILSLEIQSHHFAPQMLILGDERLMIGMFIVDLAVFAGVEDDD